MRKNLVLRQVAVVPGTLLVAMIVSACSGPGAGVHDATGNGVLAPTTLDASAPTTDGRSCCGVFVWPEDLQGALPTMSTPQPVVEHPLATTAAPPLTVPIPTTVAPPATALPPLTVPPEPTPEMVQLAQLRAAGLVIAPEDLGPDWVVEEDDLGADVGGGGAPGGVEGVPSDADGASAGFFGAPDASGPEQQAYERFVECAQGSRELFVSPIASAESPTFVAGWRQLSSFADVYLDPAIVAGQVALFRTDLGADCFAEAMGSMVAAGAEADGVSVTSSHIRRIEHPALGERGFLYDWVVGLEGEQGSFTMESFMIAVGDGSSLATAMLLFADRGDRALVDDLVRLLASKVEHI